MKDGDEKTKEYLENFPLVWKIELNCIEREYSEWIKDLREGKYLITWPWKEVKFIPILALEYLRKNPEKTMAVIGEISNEYSDGEDVIPPPGINEVLNHMFYVENVDTNDFPSDIQGEMRSFNRKDVIRKKEVIGYDMRTTITDTIGSYEYISDFSDEPFKECRNRLIQEVVSSHGEGSIHKISERKDQKHDPHVQILNLDGFVDIKLEKREQWMGELNYDVQVLWNVLLHSCDIRSIKKDISIHVFEGNINEYEFDRTNLFLIPSEIQVQEIFRLLNRIRADIIIIQNVDFFMKDKIYGGGGSYYLLKFLSEYDGTILMFSTEPDVRHLYGINSSDSIVNELDLIPHTWDSEILFEMIKKKGDEKCSIYPNPISSRWNEIPPVGEIPEVEWIELKSLDVLDMVIERVHSILGKDRIVRDIEKYIQSLQKSPLLLKGDSTEPHIFKRRGESGEMIHYYIIENELHEATGGGKEFSEIMELINGVYENGFQHNFNPILKKMSDILNEILSMDEYYVTIIVNRYDIQGTERLLCNMNYDKYIPERLNICSWGNLQKREMKILEEAIHYVISTLSPYLTYSLFSTKVKKFFFIGSHKEIEKNKKIIEYRLTETRRQPIHLLSEQLCAPGLLRSTLNDVDITPEEIQEYSEKLLLQFSETQSSLSEYSSLAEAHSSSIEKGENAILVIDEFQRGMFIPQDITLFLSSPAGISDVNLRKKSEKSLNKELKNKEILIDKLGFYISYRSIFIKYMLIHGNNITFRKGLFQWRGFVNLYIDSVQWIKVIERVIEKLSQKKSINHRGAEESIARFLSTLGLTAKNPDYIRRWWSTYETIPINDKIYHLYNVEHPRKRGDVIKIYLSLNEILPEMNLNPVDAERSYSASILIQNFRKSILREDLKTIDPSYYHLCENIGREIRKITEESPTFEVNNLYKVKVIRKVEAFRVLDEFETYIKR